MFQQFSISALSSAPRAGLQSFAHHKQHTTTALSSTGVCPLPECSCALLLDRHTQENCTKYRNCTCLFYLGACLVLLPGKIEQCWRRPAGYWVVRTPSVAAVALTPLLTERYPHLTAPTVHRAESCPQNSHANASKFDFIGLSGAGKPIGHPSHKRVRCIHMPGSELTQELMAWLHSCSTCTTAVLLKSCLSTKYHCEKCCFLRNVPGVLKTSLE